MKKFIKRTNIFLLAALIISFISPSYRQANASVSTPQPVDIVMPSNSSNGYIPSGITIKKGSNLYKSSSLLPSQYDLRTSGYVTPVRDQGQINDCWAFSTFGSMESVLKKKTGFSYDFSEINLAAQNGITTPDAGGNNYIATAYLTSWKGPVFESDDPYPSPATPTNVNSKTGLSPRYHVQNVIYLPARTGAGDNDALKNAIYTYGGVSSSYYTSNSYYANKGQGTAYYNNATTQGNHAITLIGWDDSYSKNNFGIIPPGDGAFLVKNSWGSGWGDSGYFYISYYDVSLGYDLNAVFNDVESSNNYNRMYSLYDKVYSSYYPNSDSSIDMASNVYTAQGNETIAAVSFYTFTQNIPYKVYVQKVVNGQITEPTNLGASGTMTEAGYHTVKLSSGVNVSTGDQFIVGVSLPGDEYEGTRNVSAANSYYFTSGYRQNSGIAFAIDAFTSNGAAADTLSITGEDPADGNLTPSGTISLVLDDTIAQGTSFGSISLKDGNNVEVSKNVVINGNKLSINETPQNQVGTLKLHIPKDAIKGTRGQVLAFDYDKTFTISQDSVVVNFKDKALETAVRNELGKSTGNITAGDMKSLTYVNLSNTGAFSLSGLEYAVNLMNLDCEGNNITDITPLSGLKNLQYLYLSENYIRDISALSGLTSLSDLYLENNKVSDISSLSGLTNLTSVDISNNLIKNISATQNLKNINLIDLSGNSIIDISPLQTLANNVVNPNNATIYLNNNHIDFSQGSTASNVLSVLNSKNIYCTGDTEQDQRLDPILANGNSVHSRNIIIGTNQRIVISFNEGFTLDPDFANMYSISDNSGNTGTADYTYSVSGTNLIFTPKKQLTPGSYLYISLYSGAVHSKSDASISNNSSYLSIMVGSSLTGDIDGNNTVDILDLSNLALNYNNKINTASSWNTNMDLVKDGVIDIYDLSAASSYIH